MDELELLLDRIGPQTLLTNTSTTHQSIVRRNVGRGENETSKSIWTWAYADSQHLAALSPLTFSAAYEKDNESDLKIYAASLEGA